METSTYGSELVAARAATELVMEVRHQLRMLGVPIDGPAMMHGDNQSVVLSCTTPSRSSNPSSPRKTSVMHSQNLWEANHSVLWSNPFCSEISCGKTEH